MQTSSRLYCSCEIVACEIKLVDSTSLLVCSIYMPLSPDEYYLWKLCSELDSIIASHPSSTIWIAGDVNLPDINWSNHCVSIKSQLLIIKLEQILS